MGFERSGSAAGKSAIALNVSVPVLTNNVPFYIFVLDLPEVFQVGIFEGDLSCHILALENRCVNEERTWLSLMHGDRWICFGVESLLVFRALDQVKLIGRVVTFARRGREPSGRLAHRRDGTLLLRPTVAIVVRWGGWRGDCIHLDGLDEVLILLSL